MYQATITTFTGEPKESDIHYQRVNTFENLNSYGLNVNTIHGNTEYILVEFIGRNTNFYRTANFISNTYPYDANSRYWALDFDIFSTGDNGSTVVDTNAWRRSGKVFLKSPEIYTMNWYVNPTFTNLDVANCTSIGLTTVLNLERTIDDPYVSAPVITYSEYATNDVSPSTNNTNVEYGTQTA
mgnify:CR=1 FL=1|tara:strand:+ start:4605 stop:5153 length:549 start_codon:yes stop_codon:yes gene_type:complete